MERDVYDPLARYRDEFKAKFAQLAGDKFSDLLKASGVDVAANRAVVRRIHALDRAADVQAGAVTRYGCLAALGGLIAAVGGYVWWEGTLFRESGQPIALYCFLGIAFGVVFLCQMFKRRSQAESRLKQLQGQSESARRKAWAQMEPLNRLFSWDIPLRLVEATVPRLAFDPFFTAKRLDDLRRLCGWNDTFNEERSVIGAQSGVINGNPFVFGDCLERNWGTKTYEGSLEISWMEEEEDSEGRTHRVRRYQTLYATVEKPIPVYSHRKFVIYGNDAAPNLSFTRNPSVLSGAENGFFTNLRRGWQLRKLKKLSRNLDDDSQYTLMSNHEFETLFQTTDRDNEVEYRLLFTALAQTQMLLLLKDRTIGYGDDFRFVKRRRINFLEPDHLAEASIDTDPAHFHHWSVDEARRIFQSFNEKFFKDVYFALAPILAIPLYQQTRPHADIWKGIAPESPSSFWEHESLANYFGEQAFAHPDCATHCILKTNVLERSADQTRVAVTAYGYRAETRVDYESVFGGDGYWHEVPVEWDEYLPVENVREIALTERTQPSARFATGYGNSPQAVYRRSIYSFLGH